MDVIFQREGLDEGRGVGLAQCCYVAVAVSPGFGCEVFKPQLSLVLSQPASRPARQNQTLGALHFCFPLI